MSSLARVAIDADLQTGRQPLAEVLSRGGLLAIPTESSYGLAVDPRNPEAVDTVYRLKRRERGKPLLVVAADLAQLADLGIDLESREVRFLASLWPTPLTAVLPIRQVLPASAGEKTLAVRLPAHEPLRRWLRVLGPLTATSANRSDERPIFDPAQLPALLAGQDAAILDGGQLRESEPSTLVTWQGDELRILRQGSFPAERLAWKKES